MVLTDRFDESVRQAERAVDTGLDDIGRRARRNRPSPGAASRSDGRTSYVLDHGGAGGFRGEVDADRDRIAHWTTSSRRNTACARISSSEERKTRPMAAGTTSGTPIRR